jgi:hypothetical protein
MASKATVVKNTSAGIVVEVRHLGGDSYRRSVIPAANRAWRATGRANLFPCQRFDWGVGREGVTTVTLTTPSLTRVAYAQTFDRADRLLAEARGR